MNTRAIFSASRCLALALMIVSAGSAFGARLALVIGNDQYTDIPALKNARADARAMADALKTAGFEVTLAIDLNRSAMNTAVRRFKNRISGGDEIVFFYAGHGVQLGGANYLLPVDLRSEEEEQIKDDSLQLQRVLDDIADQKARFALAIVDACRDNPFRGKGRNIGGRGLAPTGAATGQMIVFSAGAGQQALDRLGDEDTEKNSIFTRVLLKEIQTGTQPVDRALKRVRSEVVRLARSVGHEQVPAIYDQSVGDFHFRTGPDPDSAALAASSAPAAQTRPAAKPAEAAPLAVPVPVLVPAPVSSPVAAKPAGEPKVAVPAPAPVAPPAAAPVQLAAARPSAPASAPALAPVVEGSIGPRAGDVWQYEITDLWKDGAVTGVFDVRIDRAENSAVQESIVTDGQTLRSQWRLDSAPGRVASQRLVTESGSVTHFDLNHYVVVRQLLNHGDLPSGFQLPTGRCGASLRRAGFERVTVPAGSFQTERLELTCREFSGSMGDQDELKITLWYAKDHYRPVQILKETARTARGHSPLDRDLIRLVQFTPKPSAPMLALYVPRPVIAAPAGSLAPSVMPLRPPSTPAMA